MNPQPAQPNLETLFRKYRDLVYRICLRYVRNPRDAEDLTQDVFMKVQRRLAGFRGDSALTSWIYRIAVNCCLDALRTRKTHASLDDFEIDGTTALNLSSHGEASLARIDLGRILAETDARTREILFLSLAEGCSHEEVGQVVGMTKWAVGKIVIRFRKRIQVQKKAWFAELFQAKSALKAAAEPASGKNQIGRKDV